MPTCRRKRVILTQPSADLLTNDANRDVYLLAQTGEIFESYEAYSARMSFYKLKHFQCEVTGKSGLDYFQALESEQQEARTLHTRFPEPLKAAVLNAVQWQVMGRLDHLVEAVYERFKDRYFQGEKVFIDVQGDKFYARVAQVFPPKTLAGTYNSPEKSITSSLKRKRASSGASESLSSTDVASDSESSLPIHSIGGDLKLPLKDSIEQDDPSRYFYKVQILEEERLGLKDALLDNDSVNGSSTKAERRESGRQKERGSKVNGIDADGESKAKWSGSFMEVQCHVMSRDRLAFSKSLLRRFLRDCLDRDSSLASPWTVKHAIALRYHVPSDMPDDVKAGVEQVRKGEIDKRKRVWEEKELQAEREGRYTKKMKKRDEREQKAAAKAAEAEARQRDLEAKARTKAEKLVAEQSARDAVDHLAVEKAKEKKKPIRYPTEDLDVRLSEKEKKAGARVQRPIPSRTSDKLPFNDIPGAFDGFISTWNFFVCFGHPLHLSSFTLDDYEHALRHSLQEPPCSLLAEIHSVLIYNLRTIPYNRHAAVVSLLDEQNKSGSDHDRDESGKPLPTIDELASAMADVGNNWERVPLKHSEDRAGWEEALLGCLKDHATVQTFPRLRYILTRLLFNPAESANASASTSSRESSPTVSQYTATVPSERYHALAPADRILILQFMCDLAVSSKAIHVHMESCEEQLTALRKEKIEVNRQKKQLAEEMATLTNNGKEEEPPAEEPPAEEPTPNDVSDLDSEGIAPSEEASESGSTVGRRSNSSRQLSLRLKAQQGQAHARQRELARQKTAFAKHALAEHRRLDEEVNKLERRLESIEREFRKLLGVARVKPMGRDRFFNRVWWFDGCGGSSLLGSGGAVQYGAGRLFLQGPSEFDKEILNRKQQEGGLIERRKEEEGEEGMLAAGEWAVYTELDEITEFVAWLNPKGNRELALKNALTKWWDHLAPGVRKRVADFNSTARLPEARRSARGKQPGSDILREPYMLWNNRKAVN